jgi:hypothetical protein
MMQLRLSRWAAAMTIVVGAGVAFAQDDGYDDARPLLWDRDAEHPDDVFTFVRAKYSSMRRNRWGGGWRTDWPASDENLSLRLQQLTSLKVNPSPKIVELSDPTLLDYPFLYLIEPGGMSLDDVEVAGLRRFLLAGGFMMVDDFWGEREWRNFYEEMKRVLPEREPVELDISHPIFSAVIPLTQKPQVPSIHHWQGARVTYERFDGQEPHYQAWFDDDGRMMVIACHNTDLGDGWEREGEDVEYFQKFAEQQSYPMGINIIFYAMTH